MKTTIAWVMPPGWMIMAYWYIFIIVPVLFLLAVCITGFAILVTEAREHVRKTCRILLAVALAHIAAAVALFPASDVLSGNTFGRLWLLGLLCTPFLFLISALLPSAEKR